MPGRGLFYHLSTKVVKPGRTFVSRMYTSAKAKSCPSEPDSLPNSDQTYAGGTSLLPPGMGSVLCITHKKAPLITNYGLMLPALGAVVHDSETNGFSSAGFLSGHQLP